MKTDVKTSYFIAIYFWYLFCIDEFFSFVEYVFLILFYWFFSPADNFFHKHQKRHSTDCKVLSTVQCMPVARF